MRTARNKYAGGIGNALVAVAAIGLITGCGVTVDGEPATEGQGTATENPPRVEWNPCSDLPDEALRAVGADPATEEVTLDRPVEDTNFRICFWDSVDGPFHIGVGATRFTKDDWYQNTGVTGFEPKEVAGRSALLFHPDTGEEPMPMCVVTFPWKGGSIWVDVNWKYSELSSLPTSPPCELAVERAQKLEPHLPE